MNNARDALLNQCKTLLKNGSSIEAVIHVLREKGLSKVHSMEALVEIGAVSSRNEAKMMVHNSATWLEVRSRDERLHEKLIESLSDKLER